LPVPFPRAAVHRFVRLLRLSGRRIGVCEATDAMVAMAVPGIAADRGGSGLFGSGLFGSGLFGSGLFGSGLFGSGLFGGG
jgi:hypothetical protein